MARDKATAKEKDRNNDHEYQVYTDGSDYNRGIGVSAILYKNGEKISTLRYHLGRSNKHIVFEAELVGIMLGLHLLMKANSLQGMTVAMDSQAAIKATYKGHSDGAYGTIFDRINDILTRLFEKNKQLMLRLHWTLEHVEIAHNEEADKEAKWAANGDGSLPGQLLTALKKRTKMQHGSNKKGMQRKRQRNKYPPVQKLATIQQIYVRESLSTIIEV